MNQFIKGFLTATLLVSMGALAFSTGLGTGAENEDSEKFQSLQKKFQDLYDRDFTDYGQLKKAREKYKKANDILGKIMVLFLADLGLKFDLVERQKVLDAIKKGRERPSSGISGGQRERLAKTSPSSAFPKKMTSENSPWNSKERNWDVPRILERPSEFLKDVQITNMDSAFLKKKKLNQKQWAQLNGQFEGQIRFDNPNESIWTLRMNANGHWSQGGVTGEFQVELSKNGEVFSDANSSGTPRDYFGFGGSSRALLVTTMGGASVLQIYIVQDHYWVGNYYEKNNKDVFEKRGTLELTRRDN